jgi:hypothetical protein
MFMAPVPEHELRAVKAMTGYDQLLELDRLCKAYGVDEATLQAAMANLGNAPTAQTPPAPAHGSWDTTHKDVPGLEQAVAPTAPTYVDKQRLHFEYDPSREATQRREHVNQAILCSACGVALGIPDIRPIKVTCPACMFETTYTH